MMDQSSLRRFSTGVPVSATRCGARSARTARLCFAARVLDVLRLVQHHPLPLHRVQQLAIAGGERVGGRHQVAPGDRPPELLRRRAARGRGARAPAARARSAPPPRCQFPTTDIGQTRSVRRASLRPGLRPLADEQREELHRLPEPHVVRQAGAEAQPRPGSPASRGRAAGRGGGCRAARAGSRGARGGRPPRGGRRATPRPGPPPPGGRRARAPSPPRSAALPAPSSPPRRRPSPAARSAASRSSGRSSTHVPRSRTSGSFSRANARNSSGEIGSPPRASRHS